MYTSQLTNSALLPGVCAYADVWQTALTQAAVALTQRLAGHLLPPRQQKQQQQQQKGGADVDK
ncbi:hypothetical protein [Streptomyces sp. NPDC048442]|uniref:hypothetical protein n=1 Tax=Streptomyces sp. NPDC048442 TaxID=3154823 RepID=UPI003445C3B6